MTFDLIVVGLGAMGSAALYQAAQRGAAVLGIDRFDPPHTFGSSHAETRVTRLAVGEGMAYVPLVARSHEIWQELETATGRPHFHQTGGYFITPRDTSGSISSHYSHFVEDTARVAAQANIPFEVRSAAQVHAQHPTLLLAENDHAGYEPTAGIVLCERAIATQLALAQQLGATVRPNEPVLAITPEQGTVTVTTAQGTYTAERVIVSAGAWVRDFVPAAKQPLFL